VRTPDLALHNRPIQVVAVADLRIGCIAKLCLNVAALHFGKPQALKLSLRSDEIMAKVPSQSGDSSAVRKKNGPIEVTDPTATAMRENCNS
jgi:hypothetical protein